MTYEYNQYGNKAYTFPNSSGTSSSTSNPLSNFLGTVLSPLTAFIGGLFNYQSTKQTNQTNREINQQNLDYNTAMTQAQWERDDTAHQREVADLQAAGLSPLANTSGSPVSSALGAPNPIAMQAPQFDVNALVNSMVQMSKIQEEKKHNRALESYYSDQTALLAQQNKIKAGELDLGNRQLNEQIRHAAKIEELQAQANNELIANNKANNTLREKEVALQEYNKKMELLLDEIERQTHGIKMGIEFCDSPDQVAQITDINTKDFEDLLRNLNKDYTPYSEAHGEMASKGFNINGSANGITGGFGKNKAGSENSYWSEDTSKQAQALIDKYYQTHKFPILDEDKSKRNLYKGSNYYYENNYKKAVNR